MEMTEHISFPGPWAPMPKCFRSAAEVACVSVRARETVRRKDGSAAEMWIGVSCLARECSESGRVSGRYDMEQMGVLYRRGGSGCRGLVLGRFLLRGRMCLLAFGRLLLSF